MAFRLTAQKALATTDKPFDSTELRAKDLHYVEYSRDTWMTAQAGINGSRFRSAAMMESMSGDVKVVDRLYPVEFSPLPGGATKTVFTNIQHDRREMQRMRFYIAFIRGLSDGESVTLDLLDRSKALSDVGRSRLIDREILRAQIKPAVVVTGDKETDFLGDTDVQAQSSYTAGEEGASNSPQRDYQFGKTNSIKYRVNLYCKLAVTSAGAVDDAAGKKLANLVPDDIEDWIFLLKKRNSTEIGGSPCATLTPELRRVLAKHIDWKHSERTFRVGGDLNSHLPYISFKDVMFKDCPTDLLPNITSKNILSGYGTGSASSKTTAEVVAHGINAADDVIQDHISPTLLDGTPRVPSGTASNISKGTYIIQGEAIGNGANSASALEVLRENLVYVWYPRALKVNFGGLTGIYTDQLPENTFAKVVMQAVSMAACLIDENYAFQFLLPSNRISIKTKGTGTKGGTGVIV